MMLERLTYKVYTETVRRKDRVTRFQMEEKIPKGFHIFKAIVGIITFAEAILPRSSCLYDFRPGNNFLIMGNVSMNPITTVCNSVNKLAANNA